MLCSRSFLVICFRYNGVYMSIPNSQSVLAIFNLYKEWKSVILLKVRVFRNGWCVSFRLQATLLLEKRWNTKVKVKETDLIWSQICSSLLRLCVNWFSLHRTCEVYIVFYLHVDWGTRRVNNTALHLGSGLQHVPEPVGTEIFGRRHQWTFMLRISRGLEMKY